MQIHRAFPLLLCFLAAAAAHAKVHTVTLGPSRRVPYTPPESTPDTKSEDATSLRIRPLLVDGQQKEWTVGELHDVTDRTFVIRRALHINDALAGEAARWSWQPGPWLSVDRTTGRVTALHLPDFDPEVSGTLVWFRDYAAYCGVHVLAKSSSLTAMVWELGGRRAAVSQKISGWPMTPPSHTPCSAATWQRTPMRVTLRPVGMAAMTFDITGTTSLVEEGDLGDEP
jgi:hypothetical protein